MKKLILLAVFGLTFGTMVMAVSPVHRHNAAATVNKNVALQNDTNGVDAYSDTTSVAGTTYVDDNDEPDDVDDLVSILNALQKTDGVALSGKMLFLSCLSVIAFMLVCLAPFVLLFLFLRYLIKRHNDRVRLAEKAMETGQPLPETLEGVARKDTDDLVGRGTRQLSVGLGLMVLFWCFNMEPFMGIGALVAFIGGGRLLQAYLKNRRP